MKGLPVTILLIMVAGSITLGIIEPAKLFITIGSISGFFLMAYLIGKFIHE